MIQTGNPVFEEDEGRIASPEIIPADGDVEVSLRPKTLNDYIGQDTVKQNLAVYIEAARRRSEPLDHVLLYGPPGLGKTTLSGIIAHEMGVNLRITSGPAIEKPGDLAALLTNLGRGDVLFVDEIHRLSRAVEEILYPALEDRALDIMIGKGPSARSIRVDLQPFTLVGATTRAGQLSAPLRDRFGIVQRLELYTPEQLCDIIRRSAMLLDIPCEADGAMELAKRSRGTPRIANRLLRRVRDFADVLGTGVIDKETTRKALERLEIDELGLDKLDPAARYDDPRRPRRPCRTRNARLRDRRGGRDAGGCLRAVSDAARYAGAHAARQSCDTACLCASRLSVRRCRIRRRKAVFVLGYAGAVTQEKNHEFLAKKELQIQSGDTASGRTDPRSVAGGGIRYEIRAFQYEPQRM